MRGVMADGAAAVMVAVVVVAVEAGKEEVDRSPLAHMPHSRRHR
jgi:hypothetical protein